MNAWHSLEKWHNIMVIYRSLLSQIKLIRLPMKNKFCIFFIILFCSSWVNARDFNNATIELIRPDTFSLGGILVRVSGDITGAATCTFPNGITTQNYYFITSENPMMDQFLTILLSAKLTSGIVKIKGSGVCQDSYEGIRYIQLE